MFALRRACLQLPQGGGFEVGMLLGVVPQDEAKALATYRLDVYIFLNSGIPLDEDPALRKSKREAAAAAADAAEGDTGGGDEYEYEEEGESPQQAQPTHQQVRLRRRFIIDIDIRID